MPLTVCLSNLKQIGLAAFDYTDDHDTMLPSMPDLFGWGPLGAAVTTYGRFGGKAGRYLPGTPGFVASGDRLLNSYVGFQGTATINSAGALEVFHCPADTGVSFASGLGPWTSVWEMEGFSYHWNSDAINDDSVRGLWGKRISAVRPPERVVMAADWNFIGYWRGGSPSWVGRWHNRRDFRLGNVLFCDGHVAYLRAERANPTFQTGPEYTFIANREAD